MFVKCPHFKDNQCSIYEHRFKCCREFPKKEEGYYCSFRCDENCDICMDKCCNYIVVDSIENVEMQLDMSCEECKIKYKEI